MKKLFTLLLIIAAFAGKGQNLVSNGDFEQYSGCPNSYSQIDSCLFWFNPTTGMQGVSGTSDYFNQCATPSDAGVPENVLGYQYARSGSAYSGIFVYFNWFNNNPSYREYIETALTSSLIANNCYHFEMYLNLSNKSRQTTDDISVYFSDTAIIDINNSLPLPFTPQLNNPAGNNISDTLSWTLFSGDYTAAGGESYLIIGNFKNDASTSISIVNSSGTNDAYFYIDDVSLTSCATGVEEQSQSFFSISPNPFNDKIYISDNKNEVAEFILYDITSRKVLQQIFANSITMNTENLSKGMYFYEVRNANRIIKQGKIFKAGY